MKKFILKTVSALLTVMLMISIIPVDCIKNGATAILDFSVKTKAADANDFSATFTNGLKYMDSNTANSFIGFIYNVRTDRVSDDMRSMGDIYRYLTGGFTKGTDEYEYAQFCFLITSEYFINKQTSIQSSYASQATNNLITFLQKKVGSDESGAQQLVNSELGKVKGYIKKVLYYAFDMQYDETIRNIDMVMSSYNNVTSVVDKVKKLVEAVGTTINTYYLISSTNSLKAYNYYNTYLNNRDIGTEMGLLELIMNTYNIGNISIIDSIPIFLEKLGFGNSWTSEDVQRVLRVFAEFTYHSRKEFSQLSEGSKPQDTHNHTTTFYQETDSSAIFICSSCGEKFYYEKYAYDFYDNRTEVSSGYSVLKYCKYIKLDSTVLYPCKSVAKGAFSNRKYFYNIKTITIPEGYTTLGDDSFSGCWTVEDIYLPSTIKTIGKNAFHPNCTPINIHYAGTLEQWLSINLSGEICRGYNLYINGKLVKDIYLNKSKINNYIFSGCKSVETIRIGSNVKSIGNESFFSSYGDIENKKVEYDGTADNFYSLNIFGNIEDKNKLLNSFYGSELIREALYCNGEKVPYGVYYSEYDIDETVENEGWIFITSTDYKSKNIVIPNRLGQIKIKTFNINSNDYVKTIEVSEGIEIMGSLCGKSIESISIPKSVKHIYRCTFDDSYVPNIKRIDYTGTVDEFYSLNIFGSSMNEDKNEALNEFYGSEIIHNYLYCNGERAAYGLYYFGGTIDETVGTEEWICFISHDYKGESIVVPNRLGQIKIKTFNGNVNGNVKTIKISDGIEIMEGLYGKSIESISIPKSVKHIYRCTFDDSYVPNIKRIDYTGTVDEFYSLNIFGSSMNEDKNEALNEFYGSEIIHNYLYCNGERAAYGLYYFGGTIDETVGTEEWICFISHDYKGESIVVPNRLGQIKIKTFNGNVNGNVKTIKISDGIEIMEGLYGKSIESISIPKSVKHIYGHTFESYYAPNIKRIDYAGTVDEFYSLNIFGYADNDFENAMEFYNSIIDLSVYCNNKLCTTKCWFENGRSYYVGAPIIENGEYTIPNKIGKYNITGIEKLICENGKKTLYIPKSIEHIEEIVNCNDVTVKCYMNSAAHKFALNNKIKFEILDSVSVKNDSKLVLDKNAGIIYGITGGKEQIRDSIDIPDNGSITFSSSNDRIGTGTIVYVLDSDKNTVSEITATIFGDVNGDGWYDGTDAITVSMIANGMLSREQVGEAVWMAADCNHDGVINQADVDLLNQAGVLLANVDQTKSPEELLETSAEYNEYLNLIDQSVAVEEKKQETEMPDSSSSNSGLNEKILMFTEYFINLILEFFSKIF